MRASLLPLFGMSEITVMTGLQSLWQTDPVLALIVSTFALFAPFMKCIGLALVQWNLLDVRAMPAMHILGKLAMADIFLIALYITIVKGVSYARIEIAWGLYLFTACILASIILGILIERNMRTQPSANGSKA